MNRRTFAQLSAAAALGASTRAAGAQTAAKPFRIAWLAGLTGVTGPQQGATVLGAQLAAKRVNAQGGILGRPIEITTFDHQFDPSRAVRLVQDEVLTQSWDVIYPGGGAAFTGPMLPFVSRAKTLCYAPMISANPAQLTADNPYFFDLQPNPIDAANAFAVYVKQLKTKKLAIAYQSDAYGVAQSKAFEAAVKGAGIQTVSEQYDIAAVDLTPTLLKLKGENPDRLFAVAFGSAAGHILTSLDKIG